MFRKINNQKIGHAELIDYAHNTISRVLLSDKSLGMNSLGAGRCKFSLGEHSIHSCN